MGGVFLTCMQCSCGIQVTCVTYVHVRSHAMHVMATCHACDGHVMHVMITCHAYDGQVMHVMVICHACDDHVMHVMITSCM